MRTTISLLLLALADCAPPLPPVTQDLATSFADASSGISVSVAGWEFDGYPTPGQWSRFSFADVAGGGKNRALVQAAAYWCGACREVARELAAVPWPPDVVRVVLLADGDLGDGPEPGIGDAGCHQTPPTSHIF